MLNIKNLQDTVRYIIRVLTDTSVDVSKKTTPHFQRNAVIHLSCFWLSMKEKEKNLF